MSPAAQRVVDAWMIPGPVPEYHYHIRDRVSGMWPTLADAVEALVQEETEEGLTAEDLSPYDGTHD